MLWLVLTTLGAGLLAIMLLMLLAGLQVAFEPILASQSRAFALRRRATERAFELVETFVGRPQAPRAGVDLARALHRTARRLLQRAASVPQATPSPCGQGTLGVTPPEALLIAEELQARYPLPEIEVMRERMRSNVDRLSRAAPAGLEEQELVCPLLRPDAYCAAAGSRPIVCLARTGGRCAGCGIAELIDAQNVQAGISAALRASALDGEVYELNSALLAALDGTKPAADWLQGAPVFASCQRYRTQPAPQPA